VLAPGQANELPMAPGLLSFLTTFALWIVADRGYASHALRMLIWSLGSRPAIPAKQALDQPRRLNPQTGASIRVRAGKTVRFKASPILKRAI
jgi:hypothetical protein